MRSYCIFGLIACLLRAWWPDPAAAQDTDPAPVTTEITPPISTQIIWEVKSRFRLFRSEADFQRHVAAHRDDGMQTLTSVDIVLSDGTAHRLVTEIAVRDLLIAGLGDSIAAGEGNPDRAVRLSDTGFCFRRFLGSNSSEYYRPSREGYTGNR